MAIISASQGSRSGHCVHPFGLLPGQSCRPIPRALSRRAGHVA